MRRLLFNRQDIQRITLTLVRPTGRLRPRLHAVTMTPVATAAALPQGSLCSFVYFVSLW